MSDELKNAPENEPEKPEQSKELTPGYPDLAQLTETTPEGVNSDTVRRKALSQTFPFLTVNQIRFLTAYCSLGIVSEACRLARINRSTHQCWILDPRYKAAFEFCKSEARDVVEAEIRRRAVDGIDKAVYYQGEIVGHEKLYSDRLIEFYMKALDPQRFGDRQRIDVSNGQNDQQADAAVTLAEVLTPEELSDLRKRLESAARAKAQAIAVQSEPIGQDTGQAEEPGE